jgi:hypothetical protein
MSTQPTAGMGSMLPGVAAEGRRVETADDETRDTDDGVTVGEADREADVERSGGGADDDVLADPGGELIPDGLGMGSEPGDHVPVGAADAEADRQRTTDAEAG